MHRCAQTQRSGRPRRAAAALALILPGGISAAQTTAPKPNLTTLVAEAKQLEFQINALSEQYDGLRLQLARAQANAKIAQDAASRGAAALAVGQQAVAQLAAANYMNSGLDPTLAALTTGNPQQFLSQASAITELDQSSGMKVKTLSDQVTQALRDKKTADQQIAQVNALQAQMNAKKKVIDAKIDQVNSAAMKQAMAVFTQTGQYPNISIPTANTVGGQALQAALTKEGDPYVWGAAGPGNLTVPAWSCGRTHRKASRCRTTPAACGTRACTWPGATSSPAISSSSSPTSVTSGFTSAAE